MFGSKGYLNWTRVISEENGEAVGFVDAHSNMIHKYNEFLVTVGKFSRVAIGSPYDFID